MLNNHCLLVFFLSSYFVTQRKLCMFDEWAQKRVKQKDEEQNKKKIVYDQEENFLNWA